MHRLRVANLLGAASLGVGERVTAEVGRVAGVSASGAAGLSTLLVEPGIGVTELGARVGLSQPAAARMLDTLIAAGFVERERPGGRGVRLFLSEKGAGVARELLQARRRVLERVLRPLSDEQVRALAPALEALLGGLAEAEPSPKAEFLLCRLCDRGTCESCPVGAACRRKERPDG